MKKHLFFLFLIFAVSGSAQTFRGKVVSKTTGKPIDAASVCLLAKDSMIINYGISEADGIFVIENKNIEKKAAFITFQCLGYRRLMMPVSRLKQNILIKMEEKDFKLREVKVTSRRIKEKNDTIVYSVAGFAQPQDRSIADVISKMPGLEIKAGGRIAFDGKCISKLYIEGMDLMGDKYALASNNLSKKRVKSVEVLQNHQHINMLRGKDFTEQAAINLILEDNCKMQLNGSADLGAGYGDDDALYKNRLIAMMFGKNYQTLNLYKNDNTGENLYSEINPKFFTSIKEEDVEESSLISVVSTLTPNIGRSRYTFNKSHLVATNHLFQLAEKSTLRAQVSYFNDISERSNMMETEYLLEEQDNKIMREVNMGKCHKRRLDANLKVEINRDNLYFKNKLETGFDWLSSDSRTLLNDKELNLTSIPDKRFISDVIDMKLPVSDERYISIKSTNAYNKLPQELSIVDGRMQNIDYSSLYTHTMAYFRHKFFNMFANYRIGFKGERQDIEASIEGRPSLKNQRFYHYMPYFGMKLMYERNYFRIEGDADLQWIDWKWKHNDKRDGCGELQPDFSLFMRYILSNYSELSMNYNYSTNLETLRSVYDGMLFRSYRTMVDNGHYPDINQRQYVNLFYKYNQPVNGLFFSISASGYFHKNHSAMETKFSKEDNTLRRFRRNVDYNSEIYMINARFSKAFNRWKSLLCISGGWYTSKDSYIYKGELCNYDYDNYDANVSFSARPARFLSVELKSGWTQMHINSPAADTRLNWWNHNFDLSFPITDKLLLSLDNSIYQSVENNENSWFADFSLRYTLKRTEFRLDVNNIMGRSVYEREFVSSIEQNRCLYTLRPREVIVGVSFSF